MSHGKIAAEQIDNFFRGEDVARKYPLARPSMYVKPVELTDKEIEEAKRPASESLSENEAIKEARRCLRCDLETEDAKRCIESRKIAETVKSG